MRLRTTRSLITVLLILAIIVVSMNAGLALRSIQVLGQTEAMVVHTWQVIGSIGRVLGSMRDMDAGERGYLLTGDQAYLEPYTHAASILPQQIATLKSLTADNPLEQQRVAQMQVLVSRRIAFLQAGIEARQRNLSDNARLLEGQGTGKAEMDQVVALTDKMQATEQQLLTQRLVSSSAARQRARFTAILASFIDLVLIVLLFATLSRERRQRMVADDNAERLRQLQSISDIGLTQLTLPELTSELLDRLRSTIHADAAVLCMWRRNELEEEELEVVAASGTAAKIGRRLRLSEDDPIVVAARLNKVTAFTDNSTQTIPLESLRRDMRALLVIPLTISGRVVGTLLAGRKTADAFYDRDEDLLAIAADRIAMSLDRANAYEAEREARRMAEASALEVQRLNEELENRVLQRTAELEATNRELEAFSYSVSHDLRAPLRSVDGFSVALEEDYGELLDGPARDFLRRIRTGVQKMGTLIDSLLQLSRITRADLNREHVNITELAAEVAAELQHQNRDRKITFNIEPGLEAEADPRLLRVALENLLGNAVKFTSRREEAIIELGRDQETGEYFLRDNGAGFDMQYAGKLFTAFQRLHGDKDFAGSGIGLATVARVIRRHHGSIRAEGEIGVGATFRFTLGLGDYG
ncbi:sensor histidine kinase [Acidipila rosea]|uniref:histidine kinase n=1 Tax=Acidipila rosea TaxID=768535 RepID=A0A4R1L938_9BACT|nr:CHASE3 domain-containing protein [Acidipila rosea]TCK73837.1 phospho-acceptor domain-containing protein [Acidipila rosea]